MPYGPLRDRAAPAPQVPKVPRAWQALPPTQVPQALKDLRDRVKVLLGSRCYRTVLYRRNRTGRNRFTSFADFFALMPGDNAATIAAGAPVLFPQNGPNSGSGITRASAGVFNLVNAGTYRVFFQVSVTEAGQLQLRLGGLPIRTV